MNTMDAFVIGEANRDKEMMVFDWDKAARLIAEKKPHRAWAGLRGDFCNTGGMIYEGGKLITDEYTYLASTWAVPVLDVGLETVECYRMESDTPGWNESTSWPRSARNILEEAMIK